MSNRALIRPHPSSLIGYAGTGALLYPEECRCFCPAQVLCGRIFFVMAYILSPRKGALSTAVP